MHIKTRLFSGFMALLTVALLLCSCGGNSGNTPSGSTGMSTQGTAQSMADKWAAVDFGGETIRVRITEPYDDYVKPTYIVGPDQLGSNSVENLVFERNKAVQEALRLNVEAQYFTDSTITAVGTAPLDAISTWVQGNSADAPDVAIATAIDTLVRASMNNLLVNILSDEEESYFDFTADQWAYDMMRGTTLHQEKMYLLGGDAFLTVASAVGLLVNVTKYNDFFAEEQGIEYLYDTIKANKWTYDVFCSMIERGYVDRGELGKVDGEDLYGYSSFTTGWTVAPFAYSSGAEIYSFNRRGIPSYNISEETNPDFYVLLDKMTKIYSTTGWNPCGSDKNLCLTKLYAGEVLFYGNANLALYETDAIQGMDDEVTIVPYPLLREGVGSYMAFSQGGIMAGLLMTTDKFTEASAYYQMVTEQSAETLHEYYEVALKFKYSTDPNTAAMLDYMRAGLRDPQPAIFEHILHNENSSTQQAMHLIIDAHAKGSRAFATSWANMGETKDLALKDALDRFDNND